METRGLRNGVHFDRGSLRERSIYKECRFDTERPRSRPANFESVYTLVMCRSQPLQ